MTRAVVLGENSLQGAVSRGALQGCQNSVPCNIQPHNAFIHVRWIASLNESTGVMTNFKIIYTKRLVGDLKPCKVEVCILDWACSRWLELTEWIDDERKNSDRPSTANSEYAIRACLPVSLLPVTSFLFEGNTQKLELYSVDI